MALVRRDRRGGEIAEFRREQKDKDAYVALPAGVDGDDVKATYQDGILEVRIPVGDDPKTTATRAPIRRV